jgi:tetratricopeptide (TPR) repeat protein
MRWRILAIGLTIFLVSVPAALGAKAGPAPEPEFRALLQRLQRSMGTELVIVLQEIGEYNDPRFARPLVFSMNDRLPEETVRLYRREIMRYPQEAEKYLIEFIQQPIPPFYRKLDAIEMLSQLKSTRAVPHILALLAKQPQNATLKKYVDAAMLHIGDAAVSVLTDLLARKEVREFAMQYLHNAVSTEALKAELERRGAGLTDSEKAILADSDGTVLRDGRLVSDLLIGKLLQVVTGEKTEEFRAFAPTPTPLPLHKRLVEEARIQLFEEKNPFFLVAAALSVLLILFILTQIVFPKVFPNRQLNRKLAQIDKLIAAKDWDGALALGDRLEVKNISPSVLEERRREVKGKIYRMRAEEAMERCDFKAAARDFESFARVTGKDPAIFQKRVTERKIEYLTDYGWKNYAQGQLDEARSTFQTILQDDFSNARAHFALGLINLERGLLQDAVEEFRHAKNYASTLVPDYDLYLGIAFGRLEEYPSALDTLISLLERNEGILGILYFARYALALEAHLGQVKRSLERVILEAGTLSLRGKGSVMAQIEEQFRYRCRIVSSELTHPIGAAHFYLGQVYTKLGSEEEAREHLQLAAEKGYQGEVDERTRRQF